MKKYMATVVLMMAAVMSAPLLAQSRSCQVGVHAPASGFRSWQPGSKIKVYVVTTDFEQLELAFLLAPLSTWNAVSEATGSGVKFEYKGTTTAPLNCVNCLTIVRGRVFDKAKRHLTELTVQGAASDRIIIWAVVVIDPRLTNPKALTNAMAHELGHSLGLLDCYSCVKKSTVMVQFDAINVENGMNGPSFCDVAQVRAIYQTTAVQLKRLSKTKSVVDEGEEPVDDDTPVIVPKP